MFLGYISLLPRPLSATTPKNVIYKFKGAPGDGSYPLAGLVFDKTGAAYGTTSMGGSYNFGTVFKLTQSSDGGAWKETVLYNFRGESDGAVPYGGVILDSEGALYGATAGGGTGTCLYQNVSGCGVVYKLTPPVSGNSWTESVLYTFSGGNDGGDPLGSLVFGKSGNLYGTAILGGVHGGGVVFELIPAQSGSWNEDVIHSFGASGDGAEPAAGVVFDKLGNLWGTTASGGQEVYWGTVFRLQPGSSGEWVETVIYSFTNSTDGGIPGASVTLDDQSRVYSTTFTGGTRGAGTVFQVSPPAIQGGSWTETVLYSFTAGSDGGSPEAAVTFDKQGNLYSTTHNDGETGAGTVFKLTPPSTQGGAWIETVILAFHQDNGGLPNSNVVFGPGGALYGTTYVGGTYKFLGTVFKINP